MNWLLIIILFQLDANGQPTQTRAANRLFTDERSCTAAGEGVQAQLPHEVLSVMTCVPRTAFDASPAKPTKSPEK